MILLISLAGTAVLMAKGYKFQNPHQSPKTSYWSWEILPVYYGKMELLHVIKHLDL